MKRIIIPVYQFLDATALILLASLLIVVCVGVVDRYLLKTGITWTEELARYLLIWVSFISAAIATYKSRHFRVKILVNLLPRALNRTVMTLMNLLALAVLAVVFVRGIDVALVLAAQRSPAMEVQMNWIFFSLPVSVAAMMLFLVDETLDIIQATPRTD